MHRYQPLNVYHATFDDFVINNDDHYNLLSIGNYHGNASNVFNESIGEEFIKSPIRSLVWGPRLSLSVGNGHTVWGRLGSLNYLYVTVRPKEFDKNLTCPPVVAYEYDWTTTTKVDIPLERCEGTTISYSCEDAMLMEGPKDAPMEIKTYSGNASCLNVDGQFNWSYVPIFPCTFSCPSAYDKLETKHVCLRFSNETTEFGISSASLRCSEDGASLAQLTEPSDFNTSVEGNFYYTTYASDADYTLPTEAQYTCDADSLSPDCRIDNGVKCLTISKHNSTSYVRRSQDCKDETYYVCQLPEHCPNGFYPHNGLCYRILGSKNKFTDSLRECEKIGSALSYPETVEDLQFLNKLHRKHHGIRMDLNINLGIKIMIGLNSIYEDWSSGYDYKPEKDLLAIAGERNLSKPFRYAILPVSVEENVTLMAEDNHVDAGTNIAYTACQLHGPRGCWDDPPNATEHMRLEWDGELTLDTEATYKCSLGYFMNNSSALTEQFATCMGQLGGWQTVENEYYNCSLMEVCDYDQVIYTNTSFMNITESEDFMTYNSSVQFTCPPFKAMPGGARQLSSTCVYDESQDTYGFDPIDIPSCSVCTQNISVDNATSDWSTDTEYNEDMEVTITCEDGFKIRRDNGSASNAIVLKCGVLGWDVDPEDIQCLPVCSDPPEGGVNITVNVTSVFVGTNLTYVCDEGLFIPATFPNIANYTDVTCEEDRLWNTSLGLNVTDLYCAEMCFDDPITSSLIETSWDNVTRTVGTKVNLTCPDEFFLPDLSTKTSVTCEAGGRWTNLTEADILCRRLCNDPPESGINMTVNVTSLFVGTNLTYVCDEGMFIPATFPNTANYTEVTCEENRLWNVSLGLNVTDLYCAEICLEDPVTSSLTETSWDNVTRTVGTKVNLTCPDEFFLPDLSTKTSVTCEAGGQWTNLTEEDILCRRYTESLPTPPNGTTHGYPPGPYWEGVSLNFTCLDNHTSPSGEDTASIIFNGTEWVPLDPTFFCLYGCGDPAPADAPVAMNFTGYGVEGDVATYSCPVGFEGTDLKNLTSTCTGGEWTLTDIPLCNMCEAPIRPPKNVELIPDRDAFEFGAIVTYVCKGEYVNGAKELESTCVEGAWDVQEVDTCIRDTTPGPPTEPPVILPTLPPYDPSYPATSDYYWGTIQNNMTDANEKEDNYATTDGPFGFGYAVSLSSNNEQCMIHESYQVGEENCTRNPKQCADGFSFSVWEKALISEDHFGENASFSESDHKYILSTGGDDAGHPGVALYHKGYWLGAVVSTGDKFWKVEVAGIAPNDTWSNIAVRWEPPTESGEKGLELFVDLKKVGQRIYGTTASPLAPLDPALVMIGCHKTSTDTAYRGYNDAEYDEVAMWKRRLADNETNFFFGGFEANFSDVSADDFNQMINNVDLSDPDQRASAVEILKKITFEEPTPSVAPEPTSSSSTSSSSSTAVHSTASSPTASSATVAPPSDEQMARHTSLVELIEKFTSNTSIPKRINTKTHEGMMDILDSVSNLFLPSSFEKWRELQKEKPGSSKVTADLGNWLMGVSKAIVFNNGSEPYKTTKSTETILTETHKIRAGELKSLKNFYEFPEYKLLPDIRKRWNLPYDRSAVPTNLFEDSRCDSRALNIISTLYDTYDDVAPTRVNRNTMDKYLEYELDSRVMSVRAETDPVLNKYRMIDSKAPPCIPKLGKQNPIRLKFEHKVKQYTMRNLKFHSNETVIEINQRICGWFNPAIGEYGAWDRTGCKMLMTTAEYTKCACEHFGTYAIIAEQVEPREVPDEQLWLTITKYIGYILSFIALIIYIVTILVSGDLKDMFHLIGLNLAVAVFFGSIFMLVSDMDTIRDDRHICAAMGTLIQVFYLGAGAWIFVLGHASFKAITAGVISGRLRAYFFLAWSVPLMSMGLTYLLFFHDLGLDPRCFMSWVNEPKYCFFGPQIFFCAVAFIFGCIVICNMSTPALRKDNLIDDYGSFCYGGAFVMIFFAITWTFGLLAYVRFHFREVDFYPIFQVFNSWMGLIILLFIGFGSRRFRMTLAGQAKARREALFGNAFGTPAVPIEDRQHLGSPVDQRSKSATPSVSGRSSPERASSAGPEFPNKPPSTGMARASSAGQEFPNRPSSMGVVAGRPGSRPNSGF